MYRRSEPALPQLDEEQLHASTVVASEPIRLAKSVHPLTNSVYAVPSMPLIGDLTTSRIPAGTALLVEYDPASQWFNASLTMAAGWLKTGGRVLFSVATQPAEIVREQMRKLGVNVTEMEEDDKLEIDDWFTISYRAADLRLAACDEISLEKLCFPDLLHIRDDVSIMARFNDEKIWVETLLSQIIPIKKSKKITTVYGIITAVHTPWVYRRLEAAVDGIIDFKLEEENHGVTADVMRVRNLRNVAFRRGWHSLKISNELEVTIEK